MNWPLAGILALAFALRLWGIDFGLPHLYHADEPALVNHAMAHGAGDLNPHYFKLPPLLNYYLLVFYSGYFLLGRLAGWFPSREAFGALFLQDPSSFYLLGRIVTGLLFGTAGIYLIYRLGRKLFSREIGLLAALFLACSFLHARDSHYVIYDVPLTTLLTACFLFLVSIARQGGLRSYVGFGILAGLTTAAKYNGALLLFPFLLAHGWRSIREGRRWAGIFHPWFWAALGLTFAAYAFGNPFSLLDFSAFWKDFSTQAAHEGTMGFFHHLQYSLAEGMGVPLLATGLFGTFFLLRSRESAKILLPFFVFLWLVYIGIYSQPYERYALPAVPFLCLSAAAASIRLLNRPRSRKKKTFLAVPFLILLIAPPLSKTLYADLLFSRPDTRTLAKAWVEENIPHGSRLALDSPFHLPRLRFHQDQLREKLDLVKGPHAPLQQWRLDLLLKESEAAQQAYRLYFLDEGDPEARPLFARPTLPFRWEALDKEGVEYVFITRTAAEYEHPAFYAKIEEKGRMIRRFTPYRDPSMNHSLSAHHQTAATTETGNLFARERFGDVIEVYRVK